MSRRLAAVSCLALALTQSGEAGAAPQRGRRGPSAAQIKAMQEQMAYMQLEMVRYQAEIARKNEEIYKSFDEDGDGALQGGEKSRYDKHVHEIQAGKVPSPFAGIPPVGKGPRPKSSVDELKKRAAQYNAASVAQQQEILSSFDENDNGHLEGTEKSKFDKFMHDIQSGKAPNPFAALAAPDHALSGPAAKK